MRVAPQHAELLDQPFELRCAERVFDQTELDILDEYGRLMQALATREVRPHTKDEHRFYAVCARGFRISMKASSSFAGWLGRPA